MASQNLRDMIRNNRPVKRHLPPSFHHRMHINEQMLVNGQIVLALIRVFTPYFFYRLAIPLVKTFPCIILCAACPPYILNLANACLHFGHFISPRVWSSAIRSTMHFTNPPRPPLRYLYSSDLHFAQKIEMVRISLRAIIKPKNYES